jgi:hypothetical protein
MIEFKTKKYFIVLLSLRNPKCTSVNKLLNGFFWLLSIIIKCIKHELSSEITNAFQ